MAMIGPVMINPLFVAQSNNNKDSHWLTLDVCREFQRGKCSRTDNDCRFAHPPPNIEVQNGRVMCCFDSIKGKCQRRVPPCKYLHPPQHLKDTLLQNGRNNLLMKHVQMQTALANGMATGLYPMTHQYIVYNGTSFNPYYAATPSAPSPVLLPSQPSLVPPPSAPCLPPPYSQLAPSSLVDNQPQIAPSPGFSMKSCGGASTCGGSEDSRSSHGGDSVSIDTAVTPGELVNIKTLSDAENNNIAVYNGDSGIQNTANGCMMLDDNASYSSNHFFSSLSVGPDCSAPSSHPHQQFIYQSSLYVQGSTCIPPGVGIGCLPIKPPTVFSSARLDEASKLDCLGPECPTYYTPQGQPPQIPAYQPQTVAYKQMMVATVPYSPPSGYIPLMNVCGIEGVLREKSIRERRAFFDENDATWTSLTSSL